MGTADETSGRCLCISINHRKADVSRLESVFFDDVAHALRDIATECKANEVVLIQTCNRMESYLYATDPELATTRMIALLRARSLQTDIGECIEIYAGRSAANHLFRVSTSLDSMVIGEHEVLGQVSDALATAIEAGTAGIALKALFRRALAAGKRARAETDIGKGPIGVAHSAVHMANSLHGMHDKKILVVGAGKTGTLLVNSLKAHGAEDVTVLNRTIETASCICEKCGYTAAPLDELQHHLSDADLAFVSTSSNTWIITQQELALRDQGRPMLVFDLSNPRNVDPAISHISGIEIRCLDDLGDMAEKSMYRRIAESRKVERIIAEELDALDGDLRRALAGDALRDMLTRSEEIRLSELERAAKTIGCGNDDLRVLDAMSRSIVNKIMNPVIDAAKTAALSDDTARLQMIADLFRGDGE